MGNNYKRLIKNKMFTIKEKTDQEILNDYVNGVLNSTITTLGALKQKLIDDFNGTWHNPIYPPQQVLASYGINAVAAFTTHYQAQLFVKSVDPTWEMLVPPAPYTANADGSITIKTTP